MCGVHLKEEFVSHTFASGIRVLQHAVVSPCKSTAVKLTFYYFFLQHLSFLRKTTEGDPGRPGGPQRMRNGRRGWRKKEMENTVSSTSPHIIEHQKVFAKSDPFDIT